jgi:aspartate/methionine/tyrosine aminotransferase
LKLKHRFLAKRYWKDNSTALGDSVGLARSYSDLINLSIGDPDLTTDERIINAAFRDAIDGHTHYTDSFGDLELRSAIMDFYTEKYGYDVELAECMVTTSACHAMWLVMETILDDGDEVIIHEPYFTPYVQQIRLAGGIPVPVVTREENAFQLDVADLEKAITERTKAIIINTPNNPTGTCFSRETLEAIAEVAREHDILIVSDDIYTAFSYAEPFIPMTTIEGMRDRTITIGSFSKDFCMTGWRIGYILAPEYIVKTVKNVNENNVFTAPSISQRAAIHALRMRSEVQPPIIEEYRKRTYYACERIGKLNNMTVLPPRGSLYLFVNIKGTGLSSAEVTRRLLEEAHVLVVPGNAFGESGEGYLRLALTVSVEKLEEAFDRISQMELFRS